MKFSKYVSKMTKHHFGVNVDENVVHVSLGYPYQHSDEVIAFIENEDCIDNIKVFDDNLVLLRPESLTYLMANTLNYINTPAEKRFSEGKYTIQVIANNDDSYLVKIHGSNKYFISALIMKDAYGDKVLFTKSEIEMLKQRDDIAIDWNKAKIKAVD